MPAADIRAWHERVIRPTEATLVVVGDFDAEEAAGWLKSRLGRWKDRSEALPVPDRAVEPLPESARRVLLDDPARSQARVTLTCALASGPDADLEPVRVLRHTLRSRIGDSLRASAGLTYGVNTSVVRLPGGRLALELYADVDASGVGQAVAAFEGAVQELAGGEIADEALGRARLAVARSETLSLRTHRSVADYLEEHAVAGQPLSSLDGHGARIADTTAQTLQAELAPCAGRHIVVVRGPAEELGDGAGGLERFDWRAAAVSPR